MGIETTGKIYAISEAVQVSERFTKREFVLELTDNPKYPQLVQFQMSGDRCAMLDGMSIGDMVSIEFSLRGREYADKKTGAPRFFNSLDVWKIAPIGERKTTQRKSEPSPSSPAFPGEVGTQGDSDLPF